MALLAGRAVADVADGTDRLAGSAGGHQDRATLEVAASADQHAFYCVDDRRGCGESTGPCVATGEAAHVRADDLHAPCGQDLDVLLHRRLLPHLGVHGWTQDHRRPGCEQGGRQEVA